MVLPFHTSLLLDAGLKFRKIKGKGKNAMGISGKTTSCELSFGSLVPLRNNELGMLLILYHLLLDLDIESKVIGMVALYNLLAIGGRINIPESSTLSP
jgi:hypothetical protein